MTIHKLLPNIQYLIEGLDRDRQLKGNPELKAQIKSVLEGRLGGFYPSVGDPEPDPEPEPEPVDTRTPIEKIRERNRYIK